MTSNLDLLRDFLNHNLEGFEEFTHYAFEVDSEAYQAAVDLNLPIVRIEVGTVQADLFAPEPPPAYELDYERFTEKMDPFDFGGPPIEVEEDVEGYANPVAFDKYDVMFQCPRGLCTISRGRWNKGYRYCRGC